MASTPAFPSTFRAGVANFSAANTNRDGSGSLNDILTGVAAGTVVYRVVVKSETDLADGVVLLWLHNGTAYYLFDEIDTGNPAAGSNTAAAYRYEKRYDDLYLPSTSWKLAATITVAPTTGDVNVFAFGGDL